MTMKPLIVEHAPVKNKITLSYRDEAGQVTRCSFETDSLTRAEIEDWFHHVALPGIGFTQTGGGQ